MKNVRPCDLCGSLNQRRRYRLRDLDVVQCKDCDLVFIRNRTQDSASGDLYDSDYFNVRGEYFLQARQQDPGQLSGGHINSFREGLRQIHRHKTKGKLLDVGCAVGVFLALAGEEGWDVSGVDISEYATSIARKRCQGEIHTGELEAIKFPDASFDVITLWDVVEHFPHPKEALGEVHRILKDDGIILLDTPNVDSLIRKVAHWAYRVTAGTVSYPKRPSEGCWTLAGLRCWR